MSGPACLQADPEMFFPGKGEQVKSNEAVKFCHDRCGVRVECLETSLRMLNNPDGIWGGTTHRQRRGIRARMNRDN